MKIKVTDDKDLEKEIRTKLKENDGYCPCAIVKNDDTKCICKSFREQLKQGIPGKCHCELYVCEVDGEV